jgi:benzoylformate decarboxylase
VAVASTKRPILCLSGDGSSMYSIQALWTAAHHDLAVVFLILNNREYRILKHNMDTYRQRFGAKPERGYPHMDLVSPDLGFVELARGMGVDGARVSKPDELRPAIEQALAARRPFVLDVAVEGRA